MFKIIFNYAFRNIIRKKLRSFFTLLSVSLIIMLYTVLTNIGDSFTYQINSVLNQQDVDIVVQAKYATSPISSSIKMQTVEKLAHLDGVRGYESIVVGRKRFQQKSSVFILGAFSFSHLANRLGISISDGKSFSDLDNEIIIGSKMAKVFQLKVGDTIALSAKNGYKVVGIYSSWLNFLNSGIIASLDTTQKLLGKHHSISLLFITLNDTTQSAEVVKQINKKFPELRAVESQQMPSSIGLLKSLVYFSKIVSVLTLIIATAVLLNTFIMAISERTKEIGILSAIGWSRAMIISVLLVESLLLCLSGAIIGFLLAFPVIMILQNIFTNIYIYFSSMPDGTIFINVLLMAVIIATASIIFPALYATKISIAKAIRHE